MKPSLQASSLEKSALSYDTQTTSASALQVEPIKAAPNSKLIKKRLIPVIELAIATIADLIFPGLGILLDACFLIWHLLEKEEE